MTTPGMFEEHLLTVLPNTTKHGQAGVVPLVSYRVYTYFALVNDLVLICSISTFGIFTNAANIVVFLKMGFVESTNISFFALAILDLLICVYTTIAKLMYSPWLIRLHHNPNTVELGHAVSMIVLFCGGAGAWVTAIISLERCFCIMFPLKVGYVKLQVQPLCSLFTQLFQVFPK
ncbi:chemosensory receptor A [Elysia marginata]|uniref:Chemosensory receptor A n=1 Tax=Elysia marginata TaxID=1093978 RepID=A0AAV4JRM7_9GAST|nr:chemosensory receptor A [Elysia marginata]